MISPVSLIFISLCGLERTVFSISVFKAQHHASLSSLLLVLNNATFRFADSGGITALRGGPLRSCAAGLDPVSSPAPTGWGRYHNMNNVSSSGSLVSNPSAYRRAVAGVSGLNWPEGSAWAAK